MQRLSNSGITTNNAEDTEDADDTEEAPDAVADTAPVLQLHHEPESTATNQTTVEAHTLYGASLLETSRLCPSYLAGAIRRVPHAVHHTLSAGIVMTYPNEAIAGRIGYQMALEVRPNKIDHIASELFKAHFETDGGLRYLCLPGGTNVQPNPSITLRGCRMDAILPMFGPEINDALMASPMYQDDARQVLPHTTAVTMVISSQSTEHAVIFLSLGLMEGTFIANRLYM